MYANDFAQQFSSNKLPTYPAGRGSKSGRLSVASRDKAFRFSVKASVIRLSLNKRASMHGLKPC